MRCQAYCIFTSLEFACFSKRAESCDKSRLRRRGRTSSCLRPYPREDLRLKVTKPSIMRAPREHEPEGGALPHPSACADGDYGTLRKCDLPSGMSRKGVSNGTLTRSTKPPDSLLSLALSPSLSQGWLLSGNSTWQTFTP